MIDAKFADSQIKRLAGLDFFPTGKDAVAELSMSLRVADTEAIAKLVVDDFLASSTQCPKPSQMRQAAYAENERVAIREAIPVPPPPRIHCPTCQDSGISDVDPSSLHSIAAYCACEAGRRRSRGPDAYSPEIVNAQRAKLLRLRIQVPPVTGRRHGKLDPVEQILSAMDGGR